MRSSSWMVVVVVAVAAAAAAAAGASAATIPSGGGGTDAATAADTAAGTAAAALAVMDRQDRAVAGSPCATDNDCGGYAVSPPLWCRAGPGAGAGMRTCRTYVAEGAACGGPEVACPDAVAGGEVGSVECRDGRCKPVLPAAAGERCFPSLFRSCADEGLQCVVDGGAAGPGVCMTLTLEEGGVCGTPAAACRGLVCATADGTECVDNECPGGAAGTCRAPVAGDRCSGPNDGDNVTCRGDLKCGSDDKCTPKGLVGVACGASGGADACEVGYVCTTADGNTCSRDDGCPGGVAGTCRLPVEGDDCTDLRCDRVERDLKCLGIPVLGTGGGVNVPFDRRCVRAKAVGQSCSLTSPCGSTGSPRTLPCVGGVCAQTDERAVRGDECREARTCSDGTTCTSVGESRVCATTEVAAGGACDEDTFSFCDLRGGLSCIAGVCTATGALPGPLEPCRFNDDTPCAATVEEGTGATLSCKYRPGNGPSLFVCVYERPVGAPCNSGLQCASDLTCVLGTCRQRNDLRLPKNASCSRDDECDADAGLVCRSTASLPWSESVCVTSVPTGGACNWELEQCVTGDQCRDGVCVKRAPLGGACNINWDCVEGECWRGPRAAGATCREWVGFGAACDSSTVKCARRLTCGADGTCVNAVSDTTDGAFCTSSEDCAQAGGTSVCEPAGLVAGRWDATTRCRSVVGGGGACGGEWQRCVDDFWCHTNGTTGAQTCRRWVPLGGSCGGAGVACWNGLVCTDGGVCASTGVAGAPCGSTDDCGDGLSCPGGGGGWPPSTVCGREVEADGVCGGPHERCANGLSCRRTPGGGEELRCFDWVGPAGASCATPGDRCWLGLSCVNGMCA